MTGETPRTTLRAIRRAGGLSAREVARFLSLTGSRISLTTLQEYEKADAGRSRRRVPEGFSTRYIGAVRELAKLRAMDVTALSQLRYLEDLRKARDTERRSE